MTHSNKMAFDVEFYASQAALWHVRYSLKTYPPTTENPYAYLAAGTACVLCCSAATEALVNEIFLYNDIIPNWDELRLRSKIQVVMHHKGATVDWGREPLQHVGRLMTLRNWLAHHKEPFLGLSSSDGDWITDASGYRGPKIDIEKELEKVSVTRYYNAVREAGMMLFTLYDNSNGYEWLDNEDYWPLAQ